MHKAKKSPDYPEGKTAVVTIDIQLDYFWGGRFPLWRAGRGLRKARQVLDWARGRRLPVFHIRHSTDRPGASFLLAGTPGIALHPGLGVRDGEPVIDKQFPNSFRETDLESRLRLLGVTTVIWTGMISWMCVDTTVRAAKDLGFDNILVSDATASGPLIKNSGWLPGIVLPWRTQTSFMAALGAWHARVVTAAELARGHPAGHGPDTAKELFAG